jgi:hypothetical protein
LTALSLARQDWQIHQAKAATAALAIAKKLMPIPGITGDELIRQIREACPRIDVLAIFRGAAGRSHWPGEHSALGKAI